MRSFILRHIRELDRNIGLLLMAGVGHLALVGVDARWRNLGVVIAWGLMFTMACAKAYVHHVASGIPFWPGGRGRQR